jgi:superfamily I DNA and/or RNA helicase
LVDLDRAAGDGIRRVQQIELALKDDSLAADEVRRLTGRLRFLHRATADELGKALNIEPTQKIPLTSQFELAAAKLLERHKQSSPADLVAARRLLTLSREWVETLQSGHRNFEEFLAKTRTVVAGTCVGLGQTRIRLEANSFDWVIVDEAARCTASELAVPLQLGRRILLVGDHLQLLPMLPHNVALELREEFPWLTESESLRSDFERAFTSSYGRKVGRVLHEQYRMSPKICQLVSDVFYAPHGVKLQTSPNREPDPRFQTGLKGDLAEELAWIDTSNVPGNTEQRRNGNKETWNDAEIDTIIRLLERIADQERLISALASDEDPAIGIICMYKTQKERLERAFSQRPFDDRFRRMVKIDTVDAYQGKQNSIVIVSLVRANQHFGSGHVRSPNRCNVALSRARERLLIVGSLQMWKDPRNISPMQAVAQAIVDGAGRVLRMEDAA